MTETLAWHGKSPPCEAGHRLLPFRTDFVMTVCEHYKTVDLADVLI